MRLRDHTTYLSSRPSKAEEELFRAKAEVAREAMKKRIEREERKKLQNLCRDTGGHFFVSEDNFGNVFICLNCSIKSYPDYEPYGY